MVVLVMLLLFFIVVPIQGYYLGEIIALQKSRYHSKFYISKSVERHVIVTGKIDPTRLRYFVKQFYHKENYHHYRYITSFLFVCFFSYFHKESAKLWFYVQQSPLLRLSDFSKIHTFTRNSNTFMAAFW